MASLQEVTTELQTQTRSLDDVSRGVDNLVKVISQQIADEKKQAGDTLEAEVRKRRSSSSSSGPTSFKGGLVSAIKEDTGFNFLGNLARWAFGGLTGALGALGAGGLVASFTPVLGKMIGRLITKGALGAALLLFGEDLFTKAFDYTGLEQYVSISEDDKKLYAASLSKALTAGLIASIFGKKLGIATFFGSLISDSIKSVFPEDMDWQEKMKLFGLELPFSKDNFISWGAIIGTFFAPSMIKGALRTAFGLGVGAAPTTDTEQRKAFKKGFKPLGSYVRGGVRAVGWGALIAMGGGLLADAIEGFTGSTMAGEITSETANLLGLGAMFGPTGLLVMSIAAFGLAGAKIVGNYFDEKRKKLKEELISQIDVDIAEASEALDNLDTKLAAKKSELAAARINAQMPPSALIQGKDPASQEAIDKLQEVVNQGADMDPAAFRAAEAQLAQLTVDRSLTGRDVLKVAQADMMAIYMRFLSDPRFSEALATMPKDQLRYMLASEMQRMTSAGPLQDVGMLDQVINEFIDNAPGRMSTGDLGIGSIPKREDYYRALKTKAREDRDFRRDLRQYYKSIDALLPPAAAFLGSGPPPSVNQTNNTSNVSNSVHIGQEGPGPYDYLFGGSSHPYSAVGSN